MIDASFADLLSEKEGEIMRLKNELKEKNEDLAKAGELGNGLLEQNSHLEEMLERIQQDHVKVAEEYEQEKYSLENKLELMNKMKGQIEANLQEETQRWKSEASSRETKLIKAHCEEMSLAKKQHEDLTSQLQQAKLSCVQRADTLALKDAQIKKMQKELHQMKLSLNDTLSDEVAELTNENLELKIKLQEREMNEHELSQLVEQLKDMLELSKANEESLRLKKNDIEREASSYCNSLERCREECSEIRAELDMLKLQPSDPNSRGNSLFAEVEDKRIKAERDLVTMKSHYNCMKSQNEQLKHYTLKLKMQISALLETRSRTADQHHVRSLEESLAIVRNDKSKLLQRLKTVQEKFQKVSGQHVLEDPGGTSAVVQFLKNELKEKSIELERSAETLRLNEMYLMSEAKKVSSLERDLFEQGRQLDAANSTTFKLQIEIDRLKMKCGEEVKVKSYQHKWKSEKIAQKVADKDLTGTTLSSSGEDKENSNPENKSDSASDHKHCYGGNENVSNSGLTVLQEIQCKTEKSPEVCSDSEKADPAQYPKTAEKQKIVTLPSVSEVRSVDRSQVTTAADCKQQ